jgi:trans-2,3-dihydro-3-hydroxyanthranilate isomerase
MPARTYEFVQLDVFTQTPLSGNPLAVFPDARGLTDVEMQALAREMNLSETTFIFPRGGAIEALEGKKVRIFTVEAELPFAGHPTLGTALYLYASESNQKKPAEITLDLKAGKIPVRFTANSENAGGDRVDGQVFGEMRQRDPELGTPLSRKHVARHRNRSRRNPFGMANPTGLDRIDLHDRAIPQSTDALGSKV